MGNKLKDVVQGFGNLIRGKTIKDEKKRIATCNGCEFKKPGVKIHWCGKCPCHMPAKVKAPHAICPAGKW